MKQLPEALAATPWQPEIEAAVAAADAAGAVALRLYEQFVAIPKAAANISTAADREVQDLILQRLADSFPRDAFAAEEATPLRNSLRRHGDRRWVIDPIDGTRGFARKNGEFSVMIGLVVDGKVCVGVVAEPTRNRLSCAAKGGGCWQRTQAGWVGCHTGHAARIEEAKVVVSRDANAKADPRWAAAAGFLSSYSSGLKLAMVACGEADLYWRQHPFHAWDLCAGHILVEEAGGTVTNARDEPIAYEDKDDQLIFGVLATNGILKWRAE